MTGKRGTELLPERKQRVANSVASWGAAPVHDGFGEPLAEPDTNNPLPARRYCVPGGPLKILVGTVAEWRLFAPLAAAEVNGRRFLGREGERGKRGFLVRAIAKGLVRTQAAAAPMVGLARLDVDGEGFLFRDLGFGHVDLPLSNRGPRFDKAVRRLARTLTLPRDEFHSHSRFPNDRDM